MVLTYLKLMQTKGHNTEINRDPHTNSATYDMKNDHE
jgi:hypothetical protein